MSEAALPAPAVRTRAWRKALSTGARLISFVLRKALAELLVDFGQSKNGSMKHHWQAGIAQTAENFLALAQRIAKQHWSLTIVQRLATKTNHTLDYRFARWKDVVWPAVGRFHDQNIGVARLARFG